MLRITVLFSLILSACAGGVELSRSGYTLMYTHDIGYDTTWSYSLVCKCGADFVQSIVMYERAGVFYDHNFIPFCQSSFAGAAAQKKSESVGTSANSSTTPASKQASAD